MKAWPWTAVVVLITAVAPNPWSAALSASTVVVEGDPRAWADIQAAFTKLRLTAFYKIAAAGVGMTSSSGTSVTEVAVDRIHTMTRGPKGTRETIQVGRNLVRSREDEQPWMCQASYLPLPGSYIDLLIKPRGRVSATRGTTFSIGGVPTQSYSYSLGVTSRFRVFIALSDGRPRRVEFLARTGAAVNWLDFFDYDVPVVISLPRCKW